MEIPTIERKFFRLRPWKEDDADSLVRHANNPAVARNLRDGFPHPYTLKDARQWLEMITGNHSNLVLAIEADGEAVGGIGLHSLQDVYRFNAELGYWLSEKYWGRGIISDAVGLIVDHAFTRTRWLRVFATIFEHNLASMRVLEKNGFVREAIHRRAVVKQGKMMDEHLYSILKEDWKVLAEKAGRKT
ncbi:MAG: N-acetyltransferase [Bacteroidetes bacterium]|nr:MAG: N-acetyltransferase [Bacteroidota bacterium]